MDKTKGLMPPGRGCGLLSMKKEPSALGAVRLNRVHPQSGCEVFETKTRPVDLFDALQTLKGRGLTLLAALFPLDS